MEKVVAIDCVSLSTDLDFVIGGMRLFPRVTSSVKGAPVVSVEDASFSITEGEKCTWSLLLPMRSMGLLHIVVILSVSSPELFVALLLMAVAVVITTLATGGAFVEDVANVNVDLELRE
jgi:hypothetical protein